MRPQDDPDAAAVFDFLNAYLDESEKGRAHPLSAWIARFPGHEESIAREYLTLHTPPERKPDPAAHPTEATDVVERRIGPYRLLRELGRGGQGAVHLAEDTRIARRVALKVLTERFEGVSEERRRRFRREAEVIARLEHPGICGIFEADVAGDTPYIAMRFVEGETLAAVLERARRKREAGGAPSPDSDASGTRVSRSWPPHTPLELQGVLLFFERAARALHAAHEAGVVHRDLKPGNLIVSSDGRPVLLDFGLARDDEAEAGTLTRTGDVFGTPAYMSPEQLERSSAELDRRSDVWSLGATMYEALAGRRPFEGASRPELYRAIALAPLADPRKYNPALSHDVAVVLETALEKDRDRRYVTALELAEDLRRIREYEPIRAQPASAGLRLRRWTQRNPVLTVTIVALAFGLTLALFALDARNAALKTTAEALAARGSALKQADEALVVALGKHLAGRSEQLLAEDPSAALALGIEAVERAPNYLTRKALLQALEACRLEHVLDGTPAKNVNALALAPDGSRVALALDTGTVRLFELASGKQLFDLAAGEGSAVDVAFDPGSSVVVTATSKGQARMFDVHTAKQVGEIAAGEPLTGVQISPRAETVLTLQVDGRAVLWDAHTLALRATLDVGEGGIAQAVFSPDGQRLMTRSSAKHVDASRALLWDPRNGARLGLIECGPAPLTCIAIAARAQRSSSGELRRGQLAVTGAADGTLRLYDLDQVAKGLDELQLDGPVSFAAFDARAEHLLASTDRGEEGELVCWTLFPTRWSFTYHNHDGRRVEQAAFAPDGNAIASASHDMSVRTWAAPLDSRATKVDELAQIATGKRPLEVRWSPDCRRIVTRALGQVAHVFWADEGAEAFGLRGHTTLVRSVCFSPNGSLALTASDDGTARIWPVARGVGDNSLLLERGRELVLTHAGPVSSACFDVRGDLVLTTSVDATARVWDASTGTAMGAALVHPGAVLAGSFDRSAARVLTLCSDGIARVWRVGALDSKPEHALSAPGGAIRCAQFSVDGALVFTGSNDEILRTFDATSGKAVWEKRVVEIGKGGICDIALRPDGREIAVACEDNCVHFLDLESHQASHKEQFVAAPRNVRYSSDSKSLLATGRFGAGAFKVIDLERDEQAQLQLLQARDVTSGSFSPDGRFVLTTSKDGTCFVRDVRGGGLPFSLRAGNGSPALCAAFDASSSANRIISGYEDGSVRVWPVDPLPAAKARKPRELFQWELLREQHLASPLVYR